MRSIHFLSDAGGDAGGSIYATSFDDRVAVHDAESGSLVSVCGSPGGVRMNDTAVHAGLVVAGLESGAICAWDVRAPGGGGGEALKVDAAHGGNRIKGVSSMPVSGMLCSGSSNGALRVWDLRMARGHASGGGRSPACVSEADSRARISCLAVGAAVRPVVGPEVDIAPRKAAAMRRRAAGGEDSGEEDSSDFEVVSSDGGEEDSDEEGADDGVEAGSRGAAARGGGRRRRAAAGARISEGDLRDLGVAVREHRFKVAFARRVALRSALMRETGRLRET